MMKPGRYYVGDLCYVIDDNDWDYMCEYVIENNDFKVKERNNAHMAAFNTTYGDGRFEDDFGRKYSVDSGTIGCIHFDDFTVGDINGVDLAKLVERGSGAVITFKEPFEVGMDESTIYFGDIRIDTDPNNEFGGEW